MKFHKDNKFFHWGLTAFLVIAASISFYYLVFHSSNISAGFQRIMGILMPVVFGLAIAYLLAPVLNFLEQKALFPLCRKCGIKESPRQRSLVRGVGILVTCFLFVAMIYAVIAMTVSQVVPSVQGVILNFDSYTNNVISWINQTLEDNPEFGDYATKTIDRFSNQLEVWLNEILPNTASLIMTVSLSVINVLDVMKDFAVGFIISVYRGSGREDCRLHHHRPALLCGHLPDADALRRAYQRDYRLHEHHTLFRSLCGCHSQHHSDLCRGSDPSAELCVFCHFHSGPAAV